MGENMSEEIKYTPKEEFINAFTHSIGALLSIYAIVMLAVNSNTTLEAASTAVFGAMMFILFQSSTLYHAMVNKTAKKVFQRIDRSAIYMLIAGTYTPILLLTVSFPLSVALTAMTWYLAISGIIYSCLTLKFKYLSTGLYLVMGWLIIVRGSVIVNALGTIGFGLVLGGGIIYTIGAVLYGVGKKHKWMHSVFHLCCVLGSAAHIVCVLIYVI